MTGSRADKGRGGPPSRRAKRSQKVNSADKRPSAGHPVEGAPGKGKTICSNVECKLRRAGCLGYEACPGFKAKE